MKFPSKETTILLFLGSKHHSEAALYKGFWHMMMHWTSDDDRTQLVSFAQQARPDTGVT